MKNLFPLLTIFILTTGFLQAQDNSVSSDLDTRYLIIAVDGVGYDVVEEMHRKGELKNFLPPEPIINAFPSTTNPGLVEILEPLGAPPARGYEDVYFDTEKNKMRGSLFARFSHHKFIETTFRNTFDYHPNNIRMTLEYAVPLLGPWINARLSMWRLKSKFQKSDKPVFFAYVASSDLAIHLNGKWLLKNLMRRLDKLAGELRKEMKQPVEIIVFSDHGNQVRKWKRAKIKNALKQAGFKIQKKLKDERSVVLPQYGLIANASLVTQPGQEAAVAEALHHAEGVDVSVYRQNDKVVVVGRSGAATIERSETPAGNRYRYLAEEGDPLELSSILTVLHTNGAADKEGFIAAGDWLRATAEHVYPDPLRRLWQSFYWTEQPASVLVSFEDGYYTGSRLLDLFAILQATHGNLRRAQSRGVVLSTNPDLFQWKNQPFTGANLLHRIEQTRRDNAKVANAFAAPWFDHSVERQQP